MLKFAQPLPIPVNAVILTDAEKAVVAKYMTRIEKARELQAIAQESLNDIGMAIARRAGREEQKFRLSADLSCLIPEKE